MRRGRRRGTSGEGAGGAPPHPGASRRGLVDGVQADAQLGADEPGRRRAGQPPGDPAPRPVATQADRRARSVGATTTRRTSRNRTGPADGPPGSCRCRASVRPTAVSCTVWDTTVPSGRVSSSAPSGATVTATQSGSHSGRRLGSPSSAHTRSGRHGQELGVGAVEPGGAGRSGARWGRDGPRRSVRGTPAHPAPVGDPVAQGGGVDVEVAEQAPCEPVPVVEQGEQERPVVPAARRAVQQAARRPGDGHPAASRRSAARTTERGATSAPPSARTRATAPRSAARSAPAPASSSALGPATTTRPSSRWSTSTSRCPQAIASTAAAERMGWTSAAGPGARPWCSPTMGDPPVRNPASSRDRGVARGRSTSADRPHRAARPSSPRPAPRHGAPTAVSAGRTGWCRRR